MMGRPVEAAERGDDRPEARLCAKEHEQDATPRDESVRPIVEAYLRPRLTPLEFHDGTFPDLVGETVLAVIERRQRVEQSPNDKIQNLAAYARQVAQSKLDDHLRAVKPNYWSVQGSIRYLCAKDVGIATWQVGEVEVVGFSKRKGTKPVGRSTELLAESLNKNAALEELIGAYSRDRRSDILCRILAWSRGPVELDLAVRAICAAQGLQDSRRRPFPLVETPRAGPSTLDVVSNQEELRRLWQQVLKLPIRQRVALLLNLRGDAGESVLMLLPLTGIAKVQEISSALEISLDELARIWADLPLADEAIGRRLDATAHQVSNLRLAARARLRRRMQTEGYL